MTYTDFLSKFLPIYHQGNMAEIREFQTEYPEHFARFILEAQQ